MLLILENVFFSHLNSCIYFMCIHKVTSDACMRKTNVSGKVFPVSVYVEQSVCIVNSAGVAERQSLCLIACELQMTYLSLLQRVVYF